MRKSTRWMVCLTWAWFVVAACGAAGHAAQNDGPRRLELDGAAHRLRLFEEKVRRAHGQPIPLGFTEKDALRRIKALHEKYPDHPQVKEMFERARQALLASKGQMMEITPDMLKYRENEKKLKAMFLEVAEKEWAAYRAQLAKSDRLLPKAFPPPSHRDVPFSKVKGKYVVLENFEYPTNEFTTLGRQFCFVGSGARGYYFVELSSRDWIGAYEAVKRYRRFINRDMPEGMKWTLVGEIVGLDLLVPRAGKKKIGPAHWGWTVRPAAIYVPDRTFAEAIPSLELGGQFAGEASMEAIKGSMYTVTSIPDDVTPERLTEIYIAAIKEKNYPLFLECINPERRKTPRGRDRIMYHWEWHQHRFATYYCRVTVGKATVSVIKGFDTAEGSVEDFFLTDDQKAKIKKHAEPLVERAELKTVAYDERGRQYGSPKPRFFQRTEKKRWYITNYPQPF